MNDEYYGTMKINISCITDEPKSDESDNTGIDIALDEIRKALNQLSERLEEQGISFTYKNYGAD